MNPKKKISLVKKKPAEQPVKRKRGRPRKIPLVPPSNEEPIVEEPKEEPKKTIRLRRNNEKEKKKDGDEEGEQVPLNDENVLVEEGGSDDDSEELTDEQRYRIRRRMLNFFSSLIAAENQVTLEDLDEIFEEYKRKIARIGQNPFTDYRQLQNHLLQCYHQLEGIMQEVDKMLREEGQEGSNITQSNNRNYEINNEINLLNFADSSTSTIVDMFSDAEFVTHIVRKDTFRNKYTVIVYDPKWDAQINCQDPVGTNQKVLRTESSSDSDNDNDNNDDDQNNDIFGDLGETTIRSKDNPGGIRLRR